MCKISNKGNNALDLLSLWLSDSWLCSINNEQVMFHKRLKFMLLFLFFGGVLLLHFLFYKISKFVMFLSHTFFFFLLVFVVVVVVGGYFAFFLLYTRNFLPFGVMRAFIFFLYFNHIYSGIYSYYRKSAKYKNAKVKSSSFQVYFQSLLNKIQGHCFHWTTGKCIFFYSYSYSTNFQIVTSREKKKIICKDWIHVVMCPLQTWLPF